MIFDIKTLKRNPKRIHKAIEKIKGNTIVAKEDLWVQFPKRFIKNGLAIIDDYVTVVGLYATMTKDKQYSFVNVNTVTILNPTLIEYINIQDQDYVQLFFEEGSVFMTQTKLIVAQSMLNGMFNEIISMGNVPWYMDYKDLGTLYSTGGDYGGSKALNTPEAIELVASYMARVKGDLNEFYRHNVNKKYKFIGLKSVYYAAPNTLAKITNNYQEDGVLSALVTPTESLGKTEELIRE